jgi:hypothetical protein
MRKKTTLVQRFLKQKKEDIASVPHSTHTNTDTPSCRWYQSINTLPLHKFIDVAVDGNIYSLVISGDPNKDNLLSAWSDIQGEYADIIGDTESKFYLKLSKEISILKITLTQIHVMIESLAKCFYQPHLDNLNKLLHTKYTLDPDKPDQYFKTLNAALMRSKGIKIDLDLKQAHFKAIEEKNTAEKAPYTREYFISVLIALTNHAKVHINDSITVFEFAKRLKDLVNYSQQMEKWQKKKTI